MRWAYDHDHNFFNFSRKLPLLNNFRMGIFSFELPPPPKTAVAGKLSQGVEASRSGNYLERLPPPSSSSCFVMINFGHGRKLFHLFPAQQGKAKWQCCYHTIPYHTSPTVLHTCCSNNENHTYSRGGRKGMEIDTISWKFERHEITYLLRVYSVLAWVQHVIRLWYTSVQRTKGSFSIVFACIGENCSRMPAAAPLIVFAMVEHLLFCETFKSIEACLDSRTQIIMD